MSIKTDTVATAPKDDIFVELNFSCRKSLLDLSEPLNYGRTYFWAVRTRWSGRGSAIALSHPATFPKRSRRCHL